MPTPQCVPPAHMETAAVVAVAAAAGTMPWWVAAPPVTVVVAPDTKLGQTAIAIAGVWSAIVALYATWTLVHDDVAVVMALLCVWRAANDDGFKKDKQT